VETQTPPAVETDQPLPEKGARRAMPRLSLAGFRDPVRRPRWIVVTGVVLIAVATAFTVVIGLTSSRAFCAAAPCHAIQADALAAYENSSHSEISCLACHMPVNADPVTFLVHKVEVGVAGVVGVSRGTSLPINPESELAMNTKYMTEDRCTQCHTSNRRLTPSKGIIIDHAAHSKAGVTCTQCHNRIAHDETGLKLTKGSRPHEDFMKMEACFRCHDLEGKKKAAGACKLCHPADFELRPAGHSVPGFYTKYGTSTGHAKAAKADTSGRYCSSCHVRSKFCDGCHGMPVPHPADFTKTHGPAGKKSPALCANCHAKGAATAQGLEFCNACHHKQGDPGKPWIPQHFVVVAQQGANGCFICHNPTFCAHCHVEGLGQ
jgi:nitrate/TMAO reductase-like tetraheme cytochrome c subunit